MMKKIFGLLLCLALLPFGALGEEADLQLEGMVTEIVEGGFLMEDAELGEVMINTSEATVWDGLLLEGELTVGQYVLVDYSGMLTRSLPPQAHADRVGCYLLSGVVSELMEDGFLLVGDELFGDVIVLTPEAVPHLQANMMVQVYYDGVMTMSLPGKVNARFIVIPQLTGTVSDKTEESFLLTTEDGQQWQVNLSEFTVFGALSEVAEAETEEETAEETADTEEAETVEEPAPVEIKDGDRVTVFYTGISTRSLPPQIAALEVMVHP